MKTLANAAAALVLAVLYVLSIGPAMAVYEKLGYPAWAGMVIDTAYSPLLACFGKHEPPWLCDLFYRYVFLWVSQP
jgi:hypothetical protein